MSGLPSHSPNVTRLSCGYESAFLRASASAVLGACFWSSNACLAPEPLVGRVGKLPYLKLDPFDGEQEAGDLPTTRKVEIRERWRHIWLWLEITTQQTLN